MNFKIVGTNELCQKILNFIKHNEIKSDIYNKNEIEKLSEVKNNLASYNDEEAKQRSIITFEEIFFRIYDGYNIDNKSFFREVSAISGAIWAKKHLVTK